MIKKLRLKLVLILMGVVTLILLAVFATLLVTTQQSNARNSQNMLQMLIGQAGSAPAAEAPQSDDIQAFPRINLREMRLPVMLVEVDAQQNISILNKHIFFIDEQNIDAIVQLAVQNTESLGIMNEYALRYLKETTPDGIRIAFVDISMEQEIIRNLIAQSLLVGGAALLVFFFISLLLARWAVRPVEAAWVRQRQFVADASHELKTPLTVILSNADMLRANHTYDDPKKARRVEHIQAEAIRMKQLVEEMLALAKSDSVEQLHVLSRTDLSDIATNAVLIFEPMVYDEQKKLTYNIQEPLAVKGDAQRLKQLLHILLDNALKYCPKDGMITVSLADNGRNCALLQVTNEGEPIAREELQRIFHRFYRLDQSRSQQAGFGLGLAIADNIVREHGGKIWAQSDEMAGNCFFVSLPLA